MQFAGQQTGPSQIGTTFAPPPDPLQAGLGTGLAAFGALGNYFGGYQQPQYGGYGYGYPAPTQPGFGQQQPPGP